jgi:hypothetical protein
MPAKTKTVDKKNLVSVNERDCFQTPKYATQLLIPYIAANVKRVWECAAGEGRIARVLLDNGFKVEATDLQKGVNFLEQKDTFSTDIIVTNPPFSLKEEFFRQCLKFGNPFALLIPFDMNGWIVEAFDKWGCQGLVPNRRINYITPNTLKRIHEGETFKLFSDAPEYKRVKGNLIKFKRDYPLTWEVWLRENPTHCVYNRIEDAPPALLHKYSSSDFHSFWLTWQFNLPKQLTFVNLSLEEIKKNI